MCGEAKSLKELACDKREEYKRILLDKMYVTGGGLTTDSVTLSVQDRQYYDLTLHYIEISEHHAFGTQLAVGMKVITLLLKEKPEAGDAASLRNMLGTHLKRIYDKDIDWLTKRFTMVTDCASVMARVALSSVSSRVARMDQKWMGCLAHQLNTAMKCCISALADNPDLQEIFSDIQNVKKIVRIFKQSGWNSMLPNGFHLIQECETRFSTTFTVVQRFIKSAGRVKEVIDRKNSVPAKEAFAALHVDGDVTDCDMRFTALQAIVDTFHVLFELQTKVPAESTPTIHLALPLFQQCLDRLDRISDGGSVWQDQESRLVPPSRVCRKLSMNLIDWLEAKVRIHDLRLVGCYLHPLMREFQFVNSAQKRREYRGRAEEMARALIASYQVQSTEENASDASNHRAASTDAGVTQLDSTAFGEPTVTGRKRVFSIIEFADSHFQPMVALDEVSRYNTMDISVLGLERAEFMSDGFATVKFWHKRKSTYPCLYNAACRVFATPVSSCASERVFSALNRVVSRDRANTNPETLEDIIVLRSMLPHSHDLINK